MTLSTLVLLITMQCSPLRQLLNLGMETDIKEAFSTIKNQGMVNMFILIQIHIQDNLGAIKGKVWGK